MVAAVPEPVVRDHIDKRGGVVCGAGPAAWTRFRLATRATASQRVWVVTV